MTNTYFYQEPKMENKIVKAYMIMDMQFGSTGKGLLAGYLAHQEEPDTIATAWGPNAGHTYIDKSGRKFIHRMLANGVVSPNLKRILIGPGSVIDAATLLKEITECRDLLKGIDIIIHPQAAIVLPEHLETEKANVKIGSTMKGTGAAVVQRIARDPDNMNVAFAAFPKDVIDAANQMGINLYVSASEYKWGIDNAKVLQIEGAQGFSLSIYHGIYPYCTSRDVTPAQMMADCAIPYSIKPEVYGTLRTFPIRVADRFDEEGNKIGTSGPGYLDQVELDWSEVGVEPELTTVTQLPRRVFSFSYQQTEEAIRQCAPTKLFLNFANYMKFEPLMDLIATIEGMTNVEIAWIGTGPAHYDILTTLQGVEQAIEKEEIE